jgi:hypothetical protein
MTVTCDIRVHSIFGQYSNNILLHYYYILNNCVQFPIVAFSIFGHYDVHHSQHLDFLNAANDGRHRSNFISRYLIPAIMAASVIINLKSGVRCIELRAT